MTLKKQSIRKNQIITVSGEPISKDELITRSEEWSEIQENFFRKMLKQGGTFKVAGIKYKVEIVFFIPRSLGPMKTVAREAVKANLRLAAQVHSKDVEVYMNRVL